VVGSITHVRGHYAAAAASRRRVVTVGIDVEPHAPLRSGVLAVVGRDEEVARLAGLPPGVHWDRLLFSAKEAVYKAWYPLTGAGLDFGAASVTFQPDRERFSARLLAAGPVVAGRRIEVFHGRYAIRGGLAMTAIAPQAGA
jgi:4'-phosphopantetheinyl transferase EntD